MMEIIPKKPKMCNLKCADSMDLNRPKKFSHKIKNWLPVYNFWPLSACASMRFIPKFDLLQNSFVVQLKRLKYLQSNWLFSINVRFSIKLQIVKAGLECFIQNTTNIGFRVRIYQSIFSEIGQEMNLNWFLHKTRKCPKLRKPQNFGLNLPKYVISDLAENLCGRL